MREEERPYQVIIDFESKLTVEIALSDRRKLSLVQWQDVPLVLVSGSPPPQNKQNKKTNNSTPELPVSTRVTEKHRETWGFACFPGGIR